MLPRTSIHHTIVQDMISGNRSYVSNQYGINPLDKVVPVNLQTLEDCGSMEGGGADSLAGLAS